MNRLTLLAPAKINLFLHITGRREDGFHNLQTLFQLLDYGDELTFERTDDGKIHLDTNLIGVELTDNLVYRAALALQKSTLSPYGVSIQLVKRIPHGAGLGGGSSDAATTLLGLNQLWHCGLNVDQLKRIGLNLGSDVPVFIGGRSAWAEGRGEILTPLDLSEKWYFVLNPGVAISTAKIFGHPDLTRNTPTRKIAALVDGWGNNDCLILVEKLYPEVAAAREWLRQYGEARLSGTGSSLFVAFQEKQAAWHVLQSLPPKWQGFVAKGINRSPSCA